LNEDITVADFVHADDSFNLFALPLSIEAFEELADALTITQDLLLYPDASDTRSFYWGSLNFWFLLILFFFSFFLLDFLVGLTTAPPLYL
jgi:hypothetical protein